MDNIQEMNFTEEKEVYTYNIGEAENQTKVEKDASTSISYVQTIINKEQMMRILGEEGLITINNEKGELVDTFSKNSQEDENGNIVLVYNEESIKTMRLHITAPVQLGEIKLYNKKVILGNTGYEKQELEKFQKLENTIKVNESSNTLQMDLLNTKSEASININKNELSTLQKNENIQIMVTLLANQNQYDLYKNPIINIVLPQELNFEIKNVTQLNFEDIMKIKDTKITEDNEGRKILEIALEGEQLAYSEELNKDMQISITGDISISNTTPSKEIQIETLCKNENIGGEIINSQYPLKINSKYGVLVINEIENYNQEQEVIQTVDNEEATVKLNTTLEERNVKQTTQIINNYENPISEIAIIGNIEEDEKAIDMNFKEIILPEGKNAQIYYLDTNNQWTENKEELEKVKSYKIVLENEIQPEETLEIKYLLDVPEELKTAGNSYVTNTLTYKNIDNTETTNSNIKFTAKNQQASMFSVAKEANLEKMNVEISSITGTQYLQEGDKVKQGQGIRYKVRVTNTSQSDLSNIELEATNTNAIYYDKIAYEEDANGAIFTNYKIVENEELTSKILKIDSLKPGETKEVSYQISVKEVADNNQMLTGEIKIKADNYEEKTIENITNQIEKGDIKVTLRFLHSDNVLTCKGADVPLLAEVKNISDKELQDVIVEVPIAEGLKFEEKLIISKDEMGEEIPYEFLGYEDNTLKFKIPKISAKETIGVYMTLIVEGIDLTKAEETVSQYVKVINQSAEYISNDIERNVQQTQVEIIAKQTANREEKKIKNGDQIKFNFTIESKGAIEKEITIKDTIPSGLTINSAKLKVGATQREIEYNSNILREYVTIKPNEVIEIEIDTTVVEEEMDEEEIENYIKITGKEVDVESNKISFFIEVEEDNERIDEEEEINYYEDPSDSNNGNNNNYDDEEEGRTYNIAGCAWIDSNANGQKEDQEAKIANIPVWLINEETKEEVSEKTKQDGSYVFENVKQGKYIVVFQYDTKKYTVTDYQKDGVEKEVNSDVTYGTINIQNQELTVAKTKTLEVKSQKLENIDAGFRENQKFDLKIEKTVSQVTVQNSAGTKVNSYKNKKLAKVEIDAKQIANSNVIIKYNIAVTNQGDVAGYANEIVDYLPQDVTFNQENNKSWSKLKDGSIVTKELSNQIINPGETKNIELTVSKKMTQENTGTVTNRAKIEKCSSDYVTKDIDSSNNESQVDVIISVRTGRIILYISLMIIITIIIATGIYFIKKKVLLERR